MPAGAGIATVTFKLNVASLETAIVTKYDVMDVNLRTYSPDKLITNLGTFSNLDKAADGIYTNRQFTYDLSVYQTQKILLQFYATNDFGQKTIFRVDDVSISVVVQDLAPNLTPYQSSGPAPNPIWSDKITVAKSTGATSDASPIYPSDNLYVNWAVANLGNSSAGSFYTSLYIDDRFIQRWPTAFLAVSTYTYAVDYSIGKLTGGTHILKIVTDSSSDITESSESDNEYTKTIIISPATYTVTPLAGAGGSISPATVQSITAGGSITFTATPDSEYEVSEWLRAGIADQSGGLIYKVADVQQNLSVEVRFRQKLYPLVVSVTGEGDLRLDPAGQVSATIQSAAGSSFTRYYPKGTRITIAATPREGKQFSDWLGDFFGVGSQLSVIKAAKNETLSGRFIPLAVSSSLNLQMALTTPATLNITVPTQSGWITVCENSIDFLAWVVKCAHLGTGNPHVEDLFIDPAQNNFRRTQVEQVLSTPPFLNFPIKVDPENGQQLNAYNAKVSAIVDHHGRVYAGESKNLDGVIGTLEGHARHVLANGESFTHNPSREIVRSDGELALVEPSVQEVLHLPFNYVGTRRDGLSALQYDGHAGYDYSYSTGTAVYAASSGEVVTDDDFSSARGFHTSLGSLPSRLMASLHGLFIDHCNGYYTFYAHLSVIDGQYVDTSSAIWKPRKETINVDKPIGQVGQHGATSPHLHFAVYRVEETNDIKRLMIVDPYGKRALNRSERTVRLWQ